MPLVSRGRDSITPYADVKPLCSLKYFPIAEDIAQILQAVKISR